MGQVTLKTPIKPKVVNKLIIVGNGLDLALNLKTNYKDFLFWYFKNFIIKSLKNKKANFDRNGNSQHLYNKDELFLLYNRTNYNYRDVEIEKFNNSYNSFDEVKDFLMSSPQKFTYKFNSNLLAKIFEDSISGWVDIEKAYFDLLKADINSSPKQIDELNADIKFIRELLYDYLEQLDYSNSEEKLIANQYFKQLTQEIQENELLEPLPDKHVIKTNDLLFLNFNYTNSLKNILSVSKKNDVENNNKKDYTISHIHGDLLKGKDSFIFGYGDEMDIQYRDIEELNDNRYFTNIKSFKYSENSVYWDLLKFLNFEDYQVVIYGHSCGLSDRLMLNEIFEHENCKSVKIFFHNKEEFVQKTMDISRHFKSNQEMRRKIVPFNELDSIPQVKS